MTDVKRPLLRYHGGKWRIAEWIIANMPADHDVYVEPFGGAASVLLQKPPARIEVYNDLDQAVVNLFRVLRMPQRAAELRRALELTLFSRQEFEDAFIESPDDPVESARRLILRMGQSIGNKNRHQRSGWRTRTARSRISPCDAWSGFPAHLPPIIERLRYTIIECLPWEKIAALYDDKDTLFYLDPPYPHETRTRSHKNMYAFEMTPDGHQDLLRKVITMHSMIALSSYPNPLYDEVLSAEGWTRLEIEARAQTNAPRIEVLWLNPAAENRRSKQSIIFTGENDDANNHLDN